MPCVICGARPSDPDHIRSKGSGGHDEPSNLAPLCRWHHTERHYVGVATLAHRYPKYKAFIESLGWEVKLVNVWKRKNPS